MAENEAEEVANNSVANNSVANNSETAALSMAAGVRYKDAYTRAYATTEVGDFIKGVGIAVGLVIGFAALLVVLSSPQRNDGGEAFVRLLVYVGVGLLNGLIIYGLGAAIAALGQLQKSSLDCAVHSSPFLSDEQKGEVMALTTKPLDNKRVVHSSAPGKIGIRFEKQFITEVEPGSPAASAGLLVGDKILSADGQALYGDAEHDAELIGGDPGTPVVLRIWRNGRQQDFTLIRE